MNKGEATSTGWSHPSLKQQPLSCTTAHQRNKTTRFILLSLFACCPRSIERESQPLERTQPDKRSSTIDSLIPSPVSPLLRTKSHGRTKAKKKKAPLAHTRACLFLFLPPKSHSDCLAQPNTHPTISIEFETTTIDRKQTSSIIDNLNNLHKCQHQAELLSHDTAATFHHFSFSD